MAIILRRTKGSTLTHDELDDNFQQLSISNLDSAKVQGFIDSSYIQQRVPESYLETIIDSAYVQDRVTLRDSTYVTGIIDSAYILGIAPSQDFLDSSEAINLVDSAYVQARQITYNTSDFTDSSYVSGLPVSTFTNDANYLDSSTVTGVVDATYVNSVVTGALITGSGISGDGSTTPLTHPVGSYMISKCLRSVTQTYNLSSTYPGIFPGDTISGANLYYIGQLQSGGYPDGLYNSISIGSGTWKALNYVSQSVIESAIKIGGTNYDASPAILWQRVA